MNKEKAIIVNDLVFGDSGKGTFVDFLTKYYQSDLNIRYSGSSNCAHNVVLDNGIHHTFSLFGSGTFHGAKTFLSKYVLIDPLAIMEEARVLQSKGVSDPLSNLFIDENCIIITPYHAAVNRFREICRGKNSHGSCGVGLGEARSDQINKGKEFSLRLKDLETSQLLKAKLKLILTLKLYDLSLISKKENGAPSNYFDEDTFPILYLHEEYEKFLKNVNIVRDGGKKLINNSQYPILEGSQGVLLDEEVGFHPYTTWTNTTFNNAYVILDEVGWAGEVESLGAIRTYMTRHGNGPFPTERKDITTSEPHNGTNQWQGKFREGYLDLVLLRYSIEMVYHLGTAKLRLAVSHMDKLKDTIQVCNAYRYKNRTIKTLPSSFNTETLSEVEPIYETISSNDFLYYLSNNLDISIALISEGARTGDKRYLENY